MSSTGRAFLGQFMPTNDSLLCEISRVHHQTQIDANGWKQRVSRTNLLLRALLLLCNKLHRAYNWRWLLLRHDDSRRDRSCWYITGRWYVVGCTGWDCLKWRWFYTVQAIATTTATGLLLTIISWCTRRCIKVTTIWILKTTSLAKETKATSTRDLIIQDNSNQIYQRETS